MTNTSIETEIEQQIERAGKAVGFGFFTPYFTEQISIFEHGVQAAWYAEQQGHSEDVILAALLHDIGHCAYGSAQPRMKGLGAINHDWIGARLALEYGFSHKIALLIGFHVEAKRYLAGKKPAYYEKLSPASKKTLVFQGGAMSPAEQKAFEARPYFTEILQVRTNDEKGKALNFTMPNFSYYQDKMRRHLQAQPIEYNGRKKQIMLVGANQIKADQAWVQSLDKDGFDIILAMPDKIVIECLEHHFPLTMPIIRDYCFTSLHVKQGLEAQGVEYNATHDDGEDVINECVALVQKSIRHRYLLVVHDGWVNKLKSAFEQVQNFIGFRL